MNDSQTMSVRLRVCQLLEPRRDGDRIGQIVDGVLMILIISNVIAAMLSTVPSFEQQWGQQIWHFEVFSVLIFTIEYLLRIWSCVELDRNPAHSDTKSRIKWMLSPLGIVDLLAILPFYIFLFLPVTAHSTLALRLFRGLRLLRIFKLTRYSAALDILKTVARREASSLFMIAALLVIMLILSAWGIYVLEDQAHPDNFSSVPDALWWAVITLTTVGYGDVVPMTHGGKFFAGLVSIIGIAIAALPAGVLAAGFSSEVRRREQTYNRALRMALSEGSITPHQAQQLVRVREELGLSEEEAHELFLDFKHSRPSKLHCPHCGESWHPD